MRELFAALPDDPAPPAPEGLLDTALARGRRSVRRRRIGAAAAWAAVVAALAVLVVPVVPLPSRPAAPADRPALPDRFAGYSTLTGTVAESPAGRAIALYGYGNGETLNMFQPLVVGADRDTYRRVDAMDDRDRPSALLAPDGTRILLGDDRGPTGDLVLVDLTTGERRSVPIGDAVGVRLLAWSADGRTVAFSATPLAGPFDTVDFVDSEVGRTGSLRLLDLSTGRVTELPRFRPAWAAAFGPDGRRLAVQVGQEIHLVDLDGAETGPRVPLPEGRELAANVGWSPGGLITTVPQAAGHGVFLSNAGTVEFVPVGGGGATPAAVPDVVQVLGWRSPAAMIALTVDGGGHLAIAEVRLDTGGRATLSRFDTGSTCELGMQSCQVFDLHLATGLLPDLAVRRAGQPDRGPWPPALLLVVVTVAAGAAVLLWLRLRR